MSDRDPEPEFQRAILARMLAVGSPIVALAADRIWDRAPANRVPAYPYVTLGESQVLADPGDCYHGSEINFVVQGWTEDTSRAAAKALAAAIRRQLSDAEDFLIMPNHSTVSCEFIRSDVFLEQDGKTQRAAVRFRAFTEPTTE